MYAHNLSRVEGDTHGNLAEQLGIAAVPSVRFLNSNGDVTACFDYLDLLEDGEAFAAHVTEVVKRLKQQVHRKATRQQLDIELLLDAMALRTVSLDDARVAVTANASHASPAQLAAMKAGLTDLQVRELTSRARELGSVALGEALAAMAASARLPSNRLARRFWFHVFRHAITRGDIQLYEAGINDLRSRFGKTPGYDKTLARYEARLATLRRTVKK